MSNTRKDWDEHVVQAEELARTPGFQHLRDRILQLADPGPQDVVADIGAGTGLLTLAIAPQVARVWAVDIAPSMLEYLTTKAASAELDNVEATTATAASLPLVDGAVTLLVSNYCYHHLSDADKVKAVSEAFRVLAPGGRLVIGDMMFRVDVGDERNRAVIAAKVRTMLARGPAGLWRLVKNAARILTRRWEQPADSGWWRRTLREAGFEHVEVALLEHEGGIISARRPLADRSVRAARWRSGRVRSA